MVMYRVNQVHRVVQECRVFRDRMETPEILDQVGNQEKRACLELMDYQGYMEMLEHR